MRRILFLMIGWIATWVVPLQSPVHADDTERLLNAIESVTLDGRQNRIAAEAWRRLAQMEVQDLPRILAGMDNATPLAVNWLRAAVDAVAQRGVARGEALPTDALERFFLDRKHAPRARRLAFEWLARVDPSARDRLIPGMLDDPSVECRRDAVARLLIEAERLLDDDQSAEGAKVYRKALRGARDEDQILEIVKGLRDLGQKVDLPRHFGFLMNWKVIGPFDNTDRKGFDTVYPPERVIDLSAEYSGKQGPVRWRDFSTHDDFGTVDLNQPMGHLKQTVAYAWTEFTSAQPRDVELRLTCKNAWKLWLNGELLFGRDEYHRGMQLDQYRIRAALRPGRNEILLKVCQNEEIETWTVEWQFQIRVCDAVGTAILSTSRQEPSGDSPNRGA